MIFGVRTSGMSHVFRRILHMDTTGIDGVVAPEVVTRAPRFPLDPSSTQNRLLHSYAGSYRVAYNWALRTVKANLEVRAAERAAGVAEACLSRSISWSAYALNKRWNQVKEAEAPWWREVSMHAFRSGITACVNALAAWSASKSGTRKGRRVGFPRPKSKRRSKLTVTCVELNHQLSWLNPHRHHVRLMLPATVRKAAGSHQRRQQLSWIHTDGSTRRLFRLPPEHPRPRKIEGASIGVDVGLRHLATLSRPVAGLSDAHGHVPDPRPLNRRLGELARLDRAIACTTLGSNNRTRLLERRARLHGAVAETRRLFVHRLTRELAARFAVVVIGDLNLAGVARRGTKRRMGKSLAGAGLAQIRRQPAYEATEYGHQLVVVDRWFPSSKTCSACGTAKAKLVLWERTYHCTTCGLQLDRDINAAHTLETEGLRLLAGLRPESRNGDPRPDKTSATHVARHRSSEGTTPPPTRDGGVSDGDGAPGTAHGRQQQRGRWVRTPSISPCCRT